MRRTALIALSTLALALAGCGGGEEVGALPETVEGEVPAATTAAEPTGPMGDAAAGKAVYASAGCGGCHVLEAANSTGNVGPNLNESKPDYAKAVDRVTNGRGAMPPYKGQLSDEEIANVAAFVVESTSG